MMPYEQMKEDASPSDPQPPTHPSMVNVHTGPAIRQGNATTVTVPPHQGTIIAPQVGQQMVVLRTESDPMPARKTRALIGMGITQLVLGIVAILFNIGATVMWAFVVAYVGPGFWGGIMFVITGSFGIAGGKRKSRPMIITFLVLSIISTVMTVGLIATTSVGIPFSTEYELCHPYSGCTQDASLAWNILLLICGLAEFVISIVSAAICCGVICNSKNTYVACPVQYVNGSPQVAIGGQMTQPGMPQMMAPNQPVVIVQGPQR